MNEPIPNDPEVIDGISEDVPQDPDWMPKDPEFNTWEEEGGASNPEAK